MLLSSSLNARLAAIRSGQAARTQHTLNACQLIFQHVLRIACAWRSVSGGRWSRIRPVCSAALARIALKVGGA